MASRFDEQFRSAAWPAHLEQFGSDTVIAVTPYGGTAVTVSGVFDPGRRLYEVLDDGARQTSRGVLALDPSEVSNSWVPDVRDTVTIGSTAYAVTAIGRPEGSPIVELEIEAVSQRRLGGGSAYVRR